MKMLQILVSAFILIPTLFFFSRGDVNAQQCQASTDDPTLVDTWVDSGTQCSPDCSTPPVQEGTLDNISQSKSYSLCCCDPKKPMTATAYMTGIGLISTEVQYLVQDVLSIILGVVGGIAFLMLLFGSLKFIMSGGNPDAVQDAKGTITAAITGLAVVVLGILILGMIGVNILGLPGWEWKGTELITP